MKTLTFAWILSLVAIAGGLAFLWNYDVPVLKAEAAEQVTITAVGEPPVLSSGPMAFDASQPTPKDEDCPSSC